MLPIMPNRCLRASRKTSLKASNLLRFNFYRIYFQGMEGDCCRLHTSVLPQPRFAIAVFCVLAARLLCSELSAEELSRPQRLRHRAAGICLFRYETTSGGVNLLEHDRVLSGTINALHKFGQSLVHESGFVLPEVIHALQPPPFSDPTPGSIVRQLNITERSASTGKCRFRGKHQPTTQPSQPSVILLASTLALAYGMHSNDGLRAVSQCSGLYTRDPGIIACARAAFLMVAMSIAGHRDKNHIIRCAADAAGLPAIATRLLSMRVRDWRELPPDSTTTGWFIRAVKVWYIHHTCRQTLTYARRILRPRDARRFVAVMCGAYYSLPLLPENLVASAIASPKTNVLLADMYRLCNEGFLVRVPPRRNLKELLSSPTLRSRPSPALSADAAQADHDLPPGPVLALSAKDTPQQPVTPPHSRVAPGPNRLEQNAATPACPRSIARPPSPSRRRYPSRPTQPAPAKTNPVPSQTGPTPPTTPEVPSVPKIPAPPAIPGIPEMPDY